MTDDESRPTSDEGVSMGARLWGADALEGFTQRTRDAGVPALLEHSLLAWKQLDTDDRLGFNVKMLVIIACDIALGAESALRSHVFAALRNGVRYEEIAAVLSQVTPYVGVPASFRALAVLEKFRPEREEHER